MQIYDNECIFKGAKALAELLAKYRILLDKRKYRNDYRFHFKEQLSWKTIT